jgi:hypothetical protein
MLICLWLEKACAKDSRSRVSAVKADAASRGARADTLYCPCAVHKGFLNHGQKEGETKTWSKK